MATAIASAGNGNWGTAATWNPAQVPTATDTVTITHTITYDVNDDVNAIGTIAINAGGTLQWAGGVGTKALRIAGDMTITAGSLIGRDGTFIRIEPGYSILIAATAGAVFDFKGTVPNFETTMASDAAIGDGVLAVADGSGFGVGDPIAVYDYTQQDWNDRTDEGFMVHAVDGDNVYVRRWVGPSFTLSSTISSGTNTFHSTADVRAWRNGMKFVMELEVFTVDYVDSVNWIIYTTSNASSNHTSGTIGYHTGCERAHVTAQNVYKLGTHIISGSSGVAYVDVSSAAGWTGGNIVAFGGCTYAQIEERTIDSITVGGGTGGSDRINFTGNLSYTHTAGGIVIRTDRDCIIHGNTSNAITSNGGSIYQLSGSAACTISVENLELRYIGRNATYYSGFVTRNTNSATKKFLNCSFRHSYKGSYCGGFVGYGSYRMSLRNCVTYFGYYGCGLYTCYYTAFYNCISLGCNAHGNYSYVYYTMDMKYLIAESCNSYGLSFIANTGYAPQTIDGTSPENCVKYVICNYCVSATFLASNNAPYFTVECLSFANCVTRHFYPDFTGIAPTSISNVSADVYWLASSNSHSYVSSYSLTPFGQCTFITNVNFIPEKQAIIYYYGYAETDETIHKRKSFSWKFSPKRNNADSIIGFFALGQGTQGKIINLGAWVRKNSSLSGTGPFIRIYDYALTLLASDTISVAADTWEYLSLSYTFTKDLPFMVFIGGQSAAGNFWLESPAIDSSGCTSINLGCFQNIWERRNPLSGNLRLNGIKLS